MEVQSSRPWQQTVAVLGAAHNLPADEKEEVQEEGHSHYADEMEAVQEEEHSRCADAKAVALVEEHNHYAAAAADALEAAQQAAHILPVVVSQEAVLEEERIPHIDVVVADIAADTVVGPGSDIPKARQPMHSAAHYTDSSSHLASHLGSAPAWAEDHRSSRSDRQNTLLTSVCLCCFTRGWERRRRAPASYPGQIPLCFFVAGLSQ